MSSSYQKLSAGDEIRVIAPSSAWDTERAKQYELAEKHLVKLGFTVSYGKYLKPATHLGAVDTKLRARDLNDAYRDGSVKAIMALNGGWLANSVLPYIDWEMIKSNPKPFIGYSDITVLLNAIYAKTGNIGLLGPNLGTFGYRHDRDFTDMWLMRALSASVPYELGKSNTWSVGRSRKQHKTDQWVVLQKGKASGTLVGGNIATLYLLQGTEYMPRFEEDTILVVEDDDEAGAYTLREFDRRLESLLQQTGARDFIKGMMIGRFQPKSKVSMAELAKVIASKDIKNIPVIAGIDFGHTVPMITLPIGGRVKISAQQPVKCEIIEV